MANVLEKIVDDKRQEIEQRKHDFPLSEFKDHLQTCQKSFYQALAAPNASYIFECKKASPSKGLIREHFDLDEIIAAYAPQAACISVLTDEKYFQGKFEYLEYVTQRVSQAVINKDFFIDPYQVYLARYYHADAVLLMLSVLDDESYTELAALTHSLGMDVLTEVSNEEEVTRALALNANIIGINNRNLRDLSTDLATTERLVPMIKAAGHEGVIISESGIYTHAQIQRLSPLVDGFLVGSALMAEDDLPKAVQTLVFGEVKVCGVTSAEQVNMIAQFPVTYLGMIFAPQSPRYVSIENASAIVQAQPHQWVGVFVDAPLEVVIEYANKLHLFAVQLHGHESDSYISSLRELLPSACEIWQAQGVSLNEQTLPSAFTDRDKHADINVHLLDCKVGEQAGGTGKAFNWQLVSSIQDKQHLALAGGINADNVKQARQTQCRIIDINSGVEDSPGLKSEAKLKQLFRALRAY